MKHTIEIDVASTASMLMIAFPGKGSMMALQFASILLDKNCLSNAALWTRIASVIAELESQTSDEPIAING